MRKIDRKIEKTWNLHLNPGTDHMNPTESPHFLGYYFIIGTMKSGTTSLYAYVTQHPSIVAARRKELNTLVPWGLKGVSPPPPDFKKYIRDMAPEGFPSTPFMLGESSGYINKPGSLNILRDLFPKARLILSYRPAADRMASFYRMMKTRKRYPDSVSFRDTYRKWLEGSRYHDAEHAQHLLSLFPREQILVLTLNELQHDPQGTMQRVFKHLGLPPHQVDDLTPRNVTRKIPIPADQMRECKLACEELDQAVEKIWSLRLGTHSKTPDHP